MALYSLPPGTAYFLGTARWRGVEEACEWILGVRVLHEALGRMGIFDIRLNHLTSEFWVVVLSGMNRFADGSNREELAVT